MCVLSADTPKVSEWTREGNLSKVLFSLWVLVTLKVMAKLSSFPVDACHK